jgi:hypothetical protein
MCEPEDNRVLRDAACRFPEGCLCEDCGECAYCRFILSCLGDRNMFCAASGEPDDGAFPENVEHKIPAGSLAQIYELRRVFRLCS